MSVRRFIIISHWDGYKLWVNPSFLKPSLHFSFQDMSWRRWILRSCYLWTTSQNSTGAFSTAPGAARWCGSRCWPGWWTETGALEPLGPWRPCDVSATPASSRWIWCVSPAIAPHWCSMWRWDCIIPTIWARIVWCWHRPPSAKARSSSCGFHLIRKQVKINPL